MHHDPLQILYKEKGFEKDTVLEFIPGAKYAALMLQDGRIGVCATLGGVPVDPLKVEHFPDLKAIPHRISYQAYLNALLNYNRVYRENRDIIDCIPFRDYCRITMIGQFVPLLKRFSKAGIRVDAFDLQKAGNGLIPLDRQFEFVGRSDAVILTSTSIFNMTFPDILEASPDGCDIYLLGPSSILDPELFRYEKIKGIFGAAFNRYDKKVLTMIRQGRGTKSFLPEGKKVYLLR